MSKADEMFEELRYKSIQIGETIWFQRKLNKLEVKDIIFDLEQKTIFVEIYFYNEKGTLLKKESKITSLELQAINEKVKELGWNIKGLETNEIKNSIEIQLENEIERTLRFNEIANLIYKQYPNVPKQKLLSLVYNFIDNLNILNDLYSKIRPSDIKNL